MRQPRAAIALALLAAVAGCATRGDPPAVPAAAAPPLAEPEPAILDRWDGVVTADDRDRLARLLEAWDAGLTAARRAGAGRAVRGEGALLDPDAGQPRAMLPPGRYTCRVVKLGGRRGFAAFPAKFCYVAQDGALTTLVKETGAERPTGRLWSDGEDRLVFLGSMALGDEPRAPAYGAVPARDVVGMLDRVDDFRWRLTMPWPRSGSAIELIELVPFIPQDPPVS